MCVWENRQTDRQHFVWLYLVDWLLFYLEFVCFYIGCSIIKNVWSDTPKLSVCWDFFFDDSGSRYRTATVAVSGRQNEGEIWAFWVDQRHDACRGGQACKHLCGWSSSKALESNKNKWKHTHTHATTSVRSFIRAAQPLLPGISVTFGWLSSNINDLTFTSQGVIYVGRFWTFATPPECIALVYLMSATKSVIQRNTPPWSNRMHLCHSYKGPEHPASSQGS